MTIGETSVLPTDDNGNANLLVAQQASLTQTATLQSLSFYVTKAAGRLRLGVYDATGPGGGPGAKKAETAAIFPKTGWNTASVKTPVSLSPGSYWLAYLPSRNGLAFKNAPISNGAPSSRLYTYPFGPLPAVYSSMPSTIPLHWSFYATLTVDGSSSTGSGGGGPSDTTPPSTPTGLATSGIGQTSITLSWNASTDNVGVTGYRLYQDGAQVGTTSGTSSALGNLACGTSYALGVAAFDAAGNVSGTATLTASTAACSSGGPSTTFNLFVSPTGNDAGANCKRFSAAVTDPGGVQCATFAKACSLAQPGDMIGVQPGTYAAQQLANTDCPNASPSAQITFKPVSASTPPSMGASPDAPVIGGACTNNCESLLLESGSGPFGSGGNGTNGPSYVTFENFIVQGTFEATGNQGETTTGTTGIGVVFDHISTGAMYIVGLTNVLVEHSNFGPCYQEGTHPCLSENSNDWTLGGAPGGRQAVSGKITSSVFHDYIATNENDHGECYFPLDWRDFTIESSWFYNCAISGGIRIERIHNPIGTLTIQNNWFGYMYDATGGRRCSGVNWGSNSGSLSNVLIRYNSFSDGTGPTGSSGSPTSSFRIVGNLVGFDPNNDSCAEATPPTGNYGSATVASNIWIGSNYGLSSAHVANSSAFDAIYVNAAGDGSADYHLSGSPGSTMADNFVACTSGDAQLSVDKDGDPRQGPLCEAGSEER